MKSSTRSETRDRAFGYVCRHCASCCYHSDVAINPYEAARLARNFRQTVAEFRAAWTRDGEGTMLKQTETGACIFLRGKSCSVYDDRPLVCRIFPLGRELSSNGAERFFKVERDPPPGGEFTDKGTIDDFLAMQGVTPFADAADDYYHWLCAAREFLDEAGDSEIANPSVADEEAAHGLLDMDLAIARYCGAANVAEPADMESRRELHLRILYQQLDQTSANQAKFTENEDHTVADLMIGRDFGFGATAAQVKFGLRVADLRANQDVQAQHPFHSSTAQQLDQTKRKTT